MHNSNHKILEEYYKNQPVLVTGGAGFIGSHLVEQLVKYGAHVTVLDNLSTGKQENLANVQDRITFINKSVTDFRATQEATKNQTTIFHLAALVSVVESLENPSRCQDINVTGTFNMLEAARLNNVRNFFFASSSAVYGQQTKPCSEQTLANPESPYGYSKLMGELLCKQYAQSYGIKTVMGRYFNVFGPRQNPHGTYAGVVAKFTKLMEDNHPITIFGDGGQKRDFIPVEHVVQASLTLAAQPQEQVKGEAFNIASGASISVLELFKKLQTNYPHYCHAPQFSPARAGDIYSSEANCKKYNTLLAHITCL
jgi:nucleoside-diphosphate-sugar epimerase